MKSEFIALDKEIEEVEWLRQFSRGFYNGQNLCLRLSFIAIINLRLVGYRVVCIMISLDIFVVHIILLHNYSQVGLLILTM